MNRSRRFGHGRGRGGRRRSAPPSNQHIPAEMLAPVRSTRRRRGRSSPEPRSEPVQLVEIRPNDPRRILAGIALVSPPVLYQIDMVLGLTVPFLGLVGALLALAGLLGMDHGGRQELHTRLARTLLRGGVLLFLWAEVLAWIALGTGKPDWMLEPLLGEWGWWIFRGMLAPALLAAWAIPEEGVVSGLSGGVHYLLRIWHGLSLRAQHLDSSELRVLEPPPGAASGSGGVKFLGLEDGDSPRCPFCEDDLALLPVVRCIRCGTPHHRECWEEMGGCTTYACGEEECEDL